MGERIGIYLRGGLGNQLFQVFTLMSRAIDKGIDFYIIHDKSDKRPLYGLIFRNILDKISDEYTYIDFGQEHYYMEGTSRRYEEIPNGTIFMGGHFESQYYFHHNRGEIIRRLGIDGLKDRYRLLYRKTIGIHFRFEDNIGQDYVQRPEYFIRGLNMIREELGENFSDYRIVVYSPRGENDNRLTDIYIRKIKEGLEAKVEIIKFVDMYGNVETEEEFLYMSDSDYIITSLSTFGWFAYYLSDKENKRMIVSNTEDNEYEMFRLEGITVLEKDIMTEREIMRLLAEN